VVSAFALQSTRVRTRTSQYYAFERLIRLFAQPTQHRTVWELPGRPRSSRCLNLREWALLFACARFGRLALDALTARALVPKDPKPRVCLLRGDASQRPEC